jgi:PPOX class probable F420-dependent enzyme
MAALSPEVHAKLAEPTFWHLATIMEDGHPQVSPVWIDAEGDTVLVNTAKGRVKERNLRRDPRLTLSMSYPDNPYNRIEIRGRVSDFVNGAPADESIDKLAKKYLGLDEYPYRQPGEERVLLRIEPTKVIHHTA